MAMRTKMVGRVPRTPDGAVRASEGLWGRVFAHTDSAARRARELNAIANHSQLSLRRIEWCLLWAPTFQKKGNKNKALSF